jgi:acyl-CoA reductase-like NAD-dependent aldehyde dehydrogenase
MSRMLEVAGVAVSPDHYIAGQRVASEKRFDIFCPIDQRVLGSVSEGLPEHVEAAISAARQAFPAWSALTAAERKPYLDRFAEEIGQRADALCLLESNDAGVLLSRMRHGVVPRAMLNISWFAEHALDLQNRPIETEQARHIVRHDPAGVVVVITPWNAPLMLSTWKLGPALAAGNTCILKPPEWAPLTCSLLADAAHAAGLPPGVFNVVQGTGANTGAQLVVTRASPACRSPAACPPPSGSPRPQAPTWCLAAWSWAARARSSCWRTPTSTAPPPPAR